MSTIAERDVPAGAGGADLPPSSLNMLTAYERAYDPQAIINHPEFKVLDHPAPSAEDIERLKAKKEEINLACAYNEKKEVHLVVKPKPTAREGECIVRVRATGICG